MTKHKTSELPEEIRERFDAIMINTTRREKYQWLAKELSTQKLELVSEIEKLENTADWPDQISSVENFRDRVLAALKD